MLSPDRSRSKKKKKRRLPRIDDLEGEEGEDYGSENEEYFDRMDQRRGSQEDEEFEYRRAIGDMVDRSIDAIDFEEELNRDRFIHPVESLITQNRDQKLSKVVINREELF